MGYRDIVKALSEREQVSEKEIEREMEMAIRCAGLTCSTRAFIEHIALFTARKDYIS